MSEPDRGAAPATVILLMIAFSLAGPILSLAPLGMAPLTIAAAILSLAAERIGKGRWPRLPRTVTAISGLLLCWCAVSLIWDLNPGEGLRKLLDMAAIFASGLGLAGIGPYLDDRWQRRLAWSLIGGVLVGLVLLGVETAFDFPLYRMVKGDDPRLVDLVESKRSVDSLPLLVWPAALALARLRRPWLGVVLAGVFTIGCFKLTASSATLGMAVSLPVLVLATVSSKTTRGILMAATILAFALIIPLAIAAYDGGGTHAAWLKRSGQHRVEIWRFAAERTLERPLLGYGVNASRFVPNGSMVSAFQDAGKPIIPLHPHDAFLQVWLELGAVGVAIAAAFLLALLRGVGRSPPQTQPFALAGYSAALVVAALAFGLWQSWWLATLAFSIAASSAITARPQPPAEA